MDNRNRWWRYWWALGIVMAVCPMIRAQELRGIWNGTDLRVSAPKFRFLAGRTLEQVRNGRAVALDFQLSLSGVGTLKRSLERFVISYDLWEEKFSVARLERDRRERKTQSNLSETAAEEWCLEQVAVSTEGMKGPEQVSVALDVHTDEGKHETNGDPRAEPGISLTGLIEIFSRPSRAREQRWNLRLGPVRLESMRAK